MTGDVAYVQLSGATLGLYAGMEALELQQLVRVALQLDGGKCCGFQVATEGAEPSRSRHKRSPNVIPRLVPLSLACKAPELLTGRVSALIAPSDGSGHPLEPDNKPSEAEKDAPRLEKLLQALETELQLSTFEVAVLKDVCEQQKSQVLKVMGGRTSVDHKKDFLRQLLRPEDKEEDTTRPLKKDNQEKSLDPPEPVASKRNKGKRAVKANSSPARKRVRNAAVTTPSAVSVVRSLHAQHMLTSLELDIVQALVAQDDSQVLRILKDFEMSDHRDVSTLRDALVAIVEEITMELGDEEKAAAAFARGMDDAVREENEWEDSDDDGDSFGWQRHLTFLLGQWQAQHQLTPADANTLRRMVAQQHNLLESAYEVFAGDGDASELLDTLQRVAKLQRQIEQSQAGQNVQTGVPASGLSLEDVVRQMQRRGVVQAGDAAGLLVLYQGGNEALQAANEVFQADGDVHELEETLLLVVKHARFGSDEEPVDEGQEVSRLLAEYGRSGRLELWQIQILVSMLKSQDPRLLAAVDVYHEDKNAEELMDTLEILVELAAWERHRRAMVHDWIAPLARSGKLPLRGAERLVQLVKARDDRVVAALVVYLSDCNKDEFVDTLARIACLEAMKLKDVQEDAKLDESEEGHLVLAMLKELEDKGIMTGDERERVEDLVCSGEPRMLAAIDVLATTHDAEDFADTTRRILAKLKEMEIDESAEVDASADVASGTPNVSEGEMGPDEATRNAEADSENAGDEASSAAEETGQEVVPIVFYGDWSRFDYPNERDVGEPVPREEQEHESNEEAVVATDEVEEEATEAAEKVIEEVVDEVEVEGDEEEKANAEVGPTEQTQEEQN